MKNYPLTLLVIFTAFISCAQLNGIVINAGYENQFIADLEVTNQPLGLTITNNADSIRVTGRTFYGWDGNPGGHSPNYTSGITQNAVIGFKFLSPIFFDITDSVSTPTAVANWSSDITIHPLNTNNSHFFGILGYDENHSNDSIYGDWYGSGSYVEYHINSIAAGLGYNDHNGYYGLNGDTPTMINEMIWDSTYGTQWCDGYIDIEIHSITIEDAQFVPEPSTYALILGALVLGFVALRRK